MGTGLNMLDASDEPPQLSADDALREVTTILDSAPVGIGYLRHRRLVRYNLRFERMLGFGPNATQDASLTEILQQGALTPATVQATLSALAAGRACDVELKLPVAANGAYSEVNVTWCALSLRHMESEGSSDALVAVLTDITRLKLQQAETERALQERELMFNQADVGIAWVSEGRIARANSAMVSLSGLSSESLMGQPVLDLMHDVEPDQFQAEVDDHLLARGRYIGECRLRHRDGSLRWAQVSVRAVNPDDPHSDRVYSYVDVDERHRSREALSLQASRTRAVLDSVLVGIVTVGDLGIEWMNRSAQRMFAGPLEAFVGEPMACVATSEPDHPLRRSDWLDRLAEGQSEIFECRLQARDGRTFWVVGNAVAMSDASSGSRHLTFALLDIEARRQAEVKVSMAQASLQRLIETAPLAIGLFDRHSLQMVEGNRGAELFFSRPLPLLLHQAPETCLDDPVQAAALRASLELARDTSEAVRREMTRPGVNGEPLRWDARFVLLGPRHAMDGSGEAEASQILLVANDVTELRRAEQARLDQEIAQRELLVKEVHHRIKNNLQGVAGLLQQTAQRRPDIRVHLREAIGQVQAIAQVYGLQVGAGGPLDPLGMLRAIAGAVQRSLEHVIEVEAVASGSGQWVLPEAESIPLALSLNELLTNAIRHGGGLPVRCTAIATDNGVRFEIVNQGQLPEGFALQSIPTGMAGLGLVRALLPRRAAQLEFRQIDDRVLTALTLRPPSVRAASAIELRHNERQQLHLAKTA